MAKLTDIVKFKADITYVDNSLNSKVENSKVLTDVPENAVFTDTVYTKPISESIGYITDLQDTLDLKAEKSNIQFLRYNILVTVAEQDKYEIKTVDDESIPTNISALLTSQGSVFLDGKKTPHNELSFTFDTDKNYLTLNTAPTESDLTIEIERIFI